MLRLWESDLTAYQHSVWPVWRSLSLVYGNNMEKCTSFTKLMDLVVSSSPIVTNCKWMVLMFKTWLQDQVSRHLMLRRICRKHQVLSWLTIPVRLRSHITAWPINAQITRLWQCRNRRKRCWKQQMVLLVVKNCTTTQLRSFITWLTLGEDQHQCWYTIHRLDVVDGNLYILRTTQTGCCFKSS
jgi:hypothetical protein